MNSRLRGMLVAIGALFALALLVGCGGDDDSSSGTVSADSDPQEVLDTTLGGETQIESGVLDLSFELTSDGSEAGQLSASLEGPFQSGGDGQLPELDFTASASVDAADTDFSFDGGLTLTEDAAFVSYAGEDYELDDPTYTLLAQSYEQSAQLQEEEGETGSLQQFGIDPATWVTDLTNEGTEDLDGTEVVHVSGTADVTTIVEDLTSIAEQTGQAGQIDTAALDQVEDSVENATIDVYADATDDTLRQLDLDVEIADPAGDGTVTIALSIGIADPNSEQTISGPTDARPLAELLEQIPGGADALGGLGALGGASGATGATGVPPPTDGSSDPYFDCVAGAQSAEELQACADLLGP